MAQLRRPPHQRAPSSSISSPSVARKKYSLRRATSHNSSHAPAPSSISHPAPQDYRPVLVPLHPNLRRLPSRLLAHKGPDKDMVMRDPDQVIQVGTKRKRVASTNENTLINGRPTRILSRRKRLRTTSLSRRYVDFTSDDGSDMEMDAASMQSSTVRNSEEDPEGDHSGSEEEVEDGESSTDDHLLHYATPKQLARLRKPDLVRLYELSGLPDDAELLTKHEIIDCLIAGRDDFASLPPSSPPDRTDASSSDLSDDGNVAGGEETDAASLGHLGRHAATKRRTALHNTAKPNGQAIKSRSLSMGNLTNHDEIILGHEYSRKHFVEVKGESSRNSAPKRRTSAHSSPTSSTAPSTSTHQSPPATRLRTRQVSATIPNHHNISPTSGNSKNRKGKSKQVEFSEDVDVGLKTPSQKRIRERARERDTQKTKLLLKEGSDQSDVEEAVQSSRVVKMLSNVQVQPSPRRLRSKDKAVDAGKTSIDSMDEHKSRARPRRSADLQKDSGDIEAKRKRALPVRGTKRNVEASKEETQGDVLEDENAGESGSSIGEVEEESGEGEDVDVEDEDGDEDENEDEKGEDGDEEGDEDTQEEVDELLSSASATPPVSRGRRTPLRRRLRPRARKGSAAPSDGDIEDEGDEEEVFVRDEEGPREPEESGGGEEEEKEIEGDDESDELTIAVEPRKLRNGKVVGEEEDIEMETIEEDLGEDTETGEEAEEELEEELEGSETTSEIDVDAEGETDEDEAMEEEVDLTVATAKTLVRLRRDDLVRLCETRDLEPTGTKPQLAEALLQWRDRQVNDLSSPSSTGTVRPPSTPRKRKRKKNTSLSASPPVLLRPDHFHQDEPLTPIPDKEREAEQELELDLESLGLEDREIPPEKLTKLEKIGSGGFKDVFIGKFKGRRIAISEFRGTLSAMDIKELKLLGGFDHPNIVRFLGVSIPENTKETPVMVVSELCSNGDLFDYIRNVNTPSLHKILSMMLDIARGLEYLHTRKPSVIHRDCKSSNILITARGTAKIADFGLAKVKQSTRSMVKSLVGTVNWQAPELWTAHPKYNHKVDVFSCAMVFWEMLQWHLPARKFPWEGMNEHAIYDIVGAKRQRPSISGLRKAWCTDIIDLLECMWAHEHQDRPTMTEVVETLEKLLAQK